MTTAARLPRAALSTVILTIIALAVSPASADTWQVTMAGISFTPQSLSITAGDTIVWKNLSGVHTSTSGTACTPDGKWDSGIVATGETFTLAFSADGVFPYFCIPHCGFGMNGTIIVDPVATGIHDLPAPRFTLGQNHPNPFNPVTRIEYSIEELARVRIDVFDSVGRYVTTLVDKTQGPGPHAVEWDARSSTGALQATGVYYYKLLLNGLDLQTRKMILLK